MLRAPDITAGKRELTQARKAARGLFWVVGIFSFFVNLLMLTGPLFMLQVYDRVLGSRSEETLLALFILMAFLFGIMGLIDFARGRILSRIGAGFQARLDHRVFAAVLRRATLTDNEDGQNNLRDLEAVQRLLSSPVLSAFFDIPWTPIFLAIIAIFHPLLGLLAIGGGGVLVVAALLNQSMTRGALDSSNAAGVRAERMSEQIRREAEMVRSLGMQESTFQRWRSLRSAALRANIEASDKGGGFSAISRTFRLFLQSAMLALGAWLVLRGELTAGGMIAASIMLGRALSPVDTIIAQWQVVQRARQGWGQLARLLGQIGEEPPRTALPRPRARLSVIQATIIPPGEQQASVRMVSFDVEPGEAVGIIGPSGSGKSTLARAIVGAWRCSGGKIRLDGAALEQYEPDVLGRHIGYLPQRVQLFDGTIAENIARLSPDADDAAIVTAARKAAAHEMILKLPDGYDTRVTAAGGRLSGGQVQRIGLARAMYGEPVLLVLDEPNSNLDNEGSEALNLAMREVKQSGGAVLIMAHRPAAIRECDKLLVLEGGMRRAYGPRDEVLRATVTNHSAIAASQGQTGGVS
ncbi:type I secretion system permease/ATPase [Profundibacterium mesophilum]|uniref:Rhizobicin secretion n=1 Tax=Profundibacterium mesophilum KAUST100406-0324 TaxID=1037889 RepID=A0A921NXQ4_9RHOB|nr:type I secretion system permease/ATPase [Profundibacterium mesophilum]KAF0677305.1 Rhizobicin secretion [Profundibacterium mesophilum KAUST100406-0324]